MRRTPAPFQTAARQRSRPGRTAVAAPATPTWVPPKRRMRRRGSSEARPSGATTLGRAAGGPARRGGSVSTGAPSRSPRHGTRLLQNACTGPRFR